MKNDKYGFDSLFVFGSYSRCAGTFLVILCMVFATLLPNSVRAQNVDTAQRTQDPAITVSAQDDDKIVNGDAVLVEQGTPVTEEAPVEQDTPVNEEAPVEQDTTVGSSTPAPAVVVTPGIKSTVEQYPCVRSGECRVVSDREAVEIALAGDDLSEEYDEYLQGAAKQLTFADHMRTNLLRKQRAAHIIRDVGFGALFVGAVSLGLWILTFASDDVFCYPVVIGGLLGSILVPTGAAMNRRIVRKLKALEKVRTNQQEGIPTVQRLSVAPYILENGGGLVTGLVF